MHACMRYIFAFVLVSMYVLVFDSVVAVDTAAAATVGEEKSDFTDIQEKSEWKPRV